MRQPDRDLGASLHHQVFSVLRSGIVSSRYGEGDYLPGEETLTEMFKVSRTTVRRALRSLEQEGLIERRQGRGTRVLGRSVSQPVMASLSSHIDVIDRRDSGASVLAKGLERVTPPDLDRRALGLGPGETAFRLIRVRRQDGLPLWTMINYFPAAIGEALADVRFDRTTIFTALERAGRACRRAEETVGATLADPEVAAEIGVKVGAPLLELFRVMFDEAGRPICTQLTLLPPERRKLRLIIQPSESGLPDVGVLTPLSGHGDKLR
jgi:GntR family transcriptional regulator